MLALPVAVACGGSVPPVEESTGPAPAEEPAPAPDPHGEAVVVRLDAIDSPFMQEWEAAARDILLAAYDTDRSGRLQTREEVDAIPCPVWRAVDRGHGERSAEGDSIRTAYGFAPDRFFLDVLGIDRNQREHLRMDLLDCGVR